MQFNDGVYLYASYNNLNIIMKVEKGEQHFGAVISDYDTEQETHILSEIIPPIMTSISFDPLINRFIVEKYDEQSDTSVSLLADEKGTPLGAAFSTILGFKKGLGIIKTLDGYENIIDSNGNELLPKKTYRHVSYPDSCGIITVFRGVNIVEFFYYINGCMMKLNSKNFKDGDSCGN